MNYEKKYKEALERAKEIIECSKSDTKEVRMVLSFFPELADSKDERIRKDIVAAVETYGDFTQGRKEEIYAWLEKQGEKDEEIIILKDKIESLEAARIAIQELHKPAEWSEEDGKMINKLLAVVNLYYDRSGNDLDKQSCISFLKSLKDRVQPQPKQEWNEEDINMIDWLIRCCEKEHEELCNDKYGHQDIVSDLKRDCRKKWYWLESLKNRVAPQKQWKPSKEQMEALLSEVEGWIEGCPKQVILESLYNDLKKLREE